MIKDLTKKLKKLLKDPDITDLVIFGSYVKGKIRVNDLDIAVLTTSNLNRSKLKKEIEKLTKKEVHLQLLTLADYDKLILLTLIREGYSVKHNNYLAQVYGIEPVVLFKYSLKKLTNSQKVMFSRALKNFKEIEKVANRMVLVPTKLSGEFSSFLRNWNIDLESKEYNLLPLVR